jgi:hypothetical protein
MWGGLYSWPRSTPNIFLFDLKSHIHFKLVFLSLVFLGWVETD